MNYFLKTNHTNLTDDSSSFFYTFYTLLYPSPLTLSSNR